MSTQYLNLPDGRRIAYCQSSGQQPGIVFLGGYASDMDGTKVRHIETFAKQQRRAFLRFDYTGHGKSSGRFEDGCISEWRQDAEDIIREVTTGQQILVGSSMGGWISLLLAKGALKERIAAFIGIAAAPDFTVDFECHRLSRVEWQDLQEKGFCQMASEYSDDGLWVSRKLIDDGAKNLIMTKTLNLPFPVRLLQGSADTDVDQSVAIRLLNHITGRDVELRLVKDEDHRFSSERCLRMIDHTLIEVFGIVRET